MAAFDASTVDWSTYERPRYYLQVVSGRYGTAATDNFYQPTATVTYTNAWSESAWTINAAPPPAPPKNWRWFHCFRRWHEPVMVYRAPDVRRVAHVVQDRRCLLDVRRGKRKAWLASLR